MMVSNDSELVRGIQLLKEGEVEGFNILYKQTFDYVYSRARYMLQDEEDAMDLTQEIYVIVYRTINNLNLNENIYGWLKTITFRQGMKFLEKKKKIHVLESNPEEVLDKVKDDSRVIEDDYVQEQDAQIIMKCIDELSEGQRLVILAHYYDDMKVEQIAKILDISEGTVKSRLFLARNRLKALIEEQEKKQGYKLHSTGLGTLVFVTSVMLKQNEGVSQKTMNQALASIHKVLDVGAVKGTTVGVVAKEIVTEGTVKVGISGIKKAIIGIVSTVLVTSTVGGVIISNNLKDKPKKENEVQMEEDREKETQEEIQEVFDVQSYAEVIEEYQRAIAENYEGAYKYVNLYEKTHAGMQYALVDFSNDGFPELVLGGELGDVGHGFRSIYGIQDGKVQRIVIAKDGKREPFATEEFSTFTICEDGMIQFLGGKDLLAYYTYYKLKANTVELYEEERVLELYTEDGFKYYRELKGSGKREEITEAEFNDTVEITYEIQLTGIEWHPLSDFPYETQAETN